MDRRPGSEAEQKTKTVKHGEESKMSDRKEKFTPGPWRYKKGRKSHYEWGCLFTAKRGRIFLFGCENLSKDDSHLIAAAPDLYEALDMAVKDLITAANMLPDIDLALLETAKRAHSVLAKARGE